MALDRLKDIDLPNIRNEATFCSAVGVTCSKLSIDLNSGNATNGRGL